jgi:endonuclease YncB( thermonuclease family)
LLFVSCQLQAATLQGKVVSVADGDTVTVLDDQKTQHKIRLQGIDAPEKAQAFGNNQSSLCMKWSMANRLPSIIKRKTNTAELLEK